MPLSAFIQPSPISLKLPSLHITSPSRSKPRVLLERLDEANVDNDGVQLVDVDVVPIERMEKKKTKSNDGEKTKGGDLVRGISASEESEKLVKKKKDSVG